LFRPGVSYELLDGCQSAAEGRLTSHPAKAETKAVALDQAN